jgi:hypothetical protein
MVAMMNSRTAHPMVIRAAGRSGWRLDENRPDDKRRNCRVPVLVIRSGFSNDAPFLGKALQA